MSEHKRKSRKRSSSKRSSTSSISRSSSQANGKTKLVEDLILDYSQFSNSTQLLDKRKELTDVQRELDETRKECEKSLNQIEKKERDLRKKRRELTNNIIALDKFIIENERRKTKAIENERREKIDLDNTIVDIDRTKERIVELKSLVQEKKHLLRTRYQKFYDYLHSVVVEQYGQASPEEVKQIMETHKILSKNHSELRGQVDQTDEELKSKKNELDEITSRLKQIRFNKENEISHLTNRLDELRNKTNALQKDLDDDMSRLSKTKIMEGQVQMACQYLYNRVKNAMKEFTRKDNQKDHEKKGKKLSASKTSGFEEEMGGTTGARGGEDDGNDTDEEDRFKYLNAALEDINSFNVLTKTMGNKRKTLKKKKRKKGNGKKTEKHDATMKMLRTIRENVECLSQVEKRIFQLKREEEEEEGEFYDDEDSFEEYD